MYGIIYTIIDFIISIGIIILFCIIIFNIINSIEEKKRKKTDYEKIILTMNNKISNIEKDIKELKENNKKEE